MKRAASIKRHAKGTPLLLVGLGIAIGALATNPPTEKIETAAAGKKVPATLSPQAEPPCNIKGNISTNSGQRIYHLPGQKYYARTVIRPEYGERWFCSEQEARAAGWRRSKV